MTNFIAKLRLNTPPQLYFDILDSIGFEWYPQRTRFFENFEDLKDYEDQYGHFEVPRTNSLYTFLWNNQEDYRNGSLPNYKKEAFLQIGYKLLSEEDVAAKKEEILEEKEAKFEENVIENVRYAKSTTGYPNPPYPTKYLDADHTVLFSPKLRKYYGQYSLIMKRIKSGYYGGKDDIKENEFLKTLGSLGVFLDVDRGSRRIESTEAGYMSAISAAAYDSKMAILDSPLCVGGNQVLRVRPDAIFMEEFENWKQIDFAECDENCHNSETIRKEQRKLNIQVIYAKKDGCTRINFIRFNVGTTKQADDKLVRAYAELRSRIKDDNTSGVFLYLIDYPINHHHTIAYSQRVKPTPTAIDGVEEVEVLIPTTYDDVDKIHLPILDGMQLFYSSEEKMKVFGLVDNIATDDGDSEDNEAGEGAVGAGDEGDN